MAKLHLRDGCLLTMHQIEYIRARNVTAPETRPCRFLKEGCAVDLLTGVTCSRNSNVMYHPVYWNMPSAVARKVAEWTGTKVVFSD